MTVSEELHKKDFSWILSRVSHSWFCQHFNPNKAGFFEGSFTWVEVNLTPQPPPRPPPPPPHPPSYFKKNLSNINITFTIVKQSI